ncbi:hypothetical protein [Motiliproteus sp. MSK22-1]|uniref:hypothetical protein n=1 Tax=Motiliproteus sp. MSK22-1 TaxID=1897630 RepID=UPI0009767BC8|nr:hypothetical protein [Motiliproteus sp. MSK22-1]OMH39107.1 hypothetical protein BGP75_05240 [Motiliproteus sp. MSK22-1]
MRPFTIFLLSLFLYGCLDNDNAAQGPWEGMLVSNGTAVSIGTVYIGDNYIDLSNIGERYNQLSFESEGNKVLFSRKASMRTEGDVALSGNSLRYPNGTIKFSTKNAARMEINKIQGFIELTRS